MRARPASRPAGDDADARDEHDARARRVDRERPRLVVEVALVVVAVPGARTRRPRAERVGQLGRAVAGRGSKSTTSGLCFVLIRWSGQGAPIWLTSGVRAEEANATASGLRSTSSTSPSASASSAPRSAGRRLRQERGAAPVLELRDLRPPSPNRPRAAPSIAWAARDDELDRRLVALLAGLAPGDEPVLLEQHGPRGRGALRAAGRCAATCRSPGRW